MIKEPFKVMLPDVSGNSNHIPIAVNWNKRVKNCGYVKLYPGTKHEAVIKQDHLLSVLFMLAKQEDQQRMMKRRIVTTKEFTYPVTIIPSRDVKKGEKIQSYVSFRIPVDTQDKTIKDEDIIKKG